MEVEAVDEGTLSSDPGAGGHREREGQYADCGASAKATAEPAMRRNHRSRAKPKAEKKPAGQRTEERAPAAPPTASGSPRSDPEVPEGTEMVAMTVREALRPAMTRGDAPRRQRVPDRRGGRPVSGRLQDQPGHARRIRRPSASSIRRSPSMASPASQSARPLPDCGRSSNS